MARPNDELTMAVDAMLAHAKFVGVIDNLPEPFKTKLLQLANVRNRMWLNELPDYDAPTTDDMDDSERKALEDAIGHG